MTNRSDVGYCPECDAKINVKSPKVGQIVVCRGCDTRLEVIDTRPLDLDWAFEDDLDDEFEDMEYAFEDEDAVFEDD